MYSTIFEWCKQRLVTLLLIIIFLLSLAVLWLYFKPDQSDVEWRQVNEQMTKTLKTTNATSDKLTEEKVDKPSEITWPIDLNRATLAQFDELPGIGPSKAQAIIDYRTSIGQFNSVQQLLDVKGIGEKTLAKFRDKVTISQ